MNEMSYFKFVSDKKDKSLTLHKR